MADKEKEEEILRLLGEIETRLKMTEITTKLIKAQITLTEFHDVMAKVRSPVETFQHQIIDTLFNLLILTIEIYIVLFGYRYITSSGEKIPSIAFIGAIGIVLIILKDSLNNVRNLYSTYNAWRRMKETKKFHLDQQIKSKTVEEYIQNLKKMDRELRAKKFGNNELSSPDNQLVRSVEENP